MNLTQNQRFWLTLLSFFLSFVSCFLFALLTFVRWKQKEGGMTLYVKAGPDGKSLGDCPFAHFVRMVLHEKKLEYDLIPSVQETKPAWLIRHYEGKMPALRHRRECYVESSVIAQYLDFFFPQPVSLTATNKEAQQNAQDKVYGFFPDAARYLKHSPDGNEQDAERKMHLERHLGLVEEHLGSTEGDYLCGDQFTLEDCSIAPKLFHLQVGLKAFKNNAIDIPKDYPNLQGYMDRVFARPSFQETLCPEETVVWGWTQAREKQALTAPAPRDDD